jgi:hypothetical protein
MHVEPAEAHALLDEVDGIVQRVKQSNIYRNSSTAMMAWGVIVAFGYVLTDLRPRSASLMWIVLNLIGFALTIAIGFRGGRRNVLHHWKVYLTIALFFGFGLSWVFLGHFGGRQLDAFWPSLFMFGYSLAGLFFGLAFTAIGIGLALLIFAGYLWSGHWFDLYLALVVGGGLMVCGLWMRRA